MVECLIRLREHCTACVRCLSVAQLFPPFVDLRLKLITERMLDALAKVGCRLQVVDRSSKVAL